MTRWLETIGAVSPTDWYTAFLGFLAVLFLLLIVEHTRKHLGFQAYISRKIVHIITGLIICYVAVMIHSNIPILLIAFLYIFADLWAMRMGLFKSIHTNSASYGTVFYGISVFVLAIVFWGTFKPIFIITNLIMVIPDALAALIGTRYSNSFFVPLKERKSLLGAITMFTGTIIIILVMHAIFFDHISIITVLIALTIGLVASIAELLSAHGSDNLTVPVLSGLYLYIFLVLPAPSDHLNLFYGTLAALVVALLSYRFRLLSLSGALTTILVGSLIFGLGGLSFTIPILLFFILSSILSKTGKSRKKSVENSYQKTGVRDFYQVLANGGVGTILVILFFFTGVDHIYYIYLAAVAAATADTWGTEIGIFQKKDPFLITTFERVGPGTSGAISALGLVSGLIGSLIIILSGSLYHEMNLNVLILLTLSGFAGSLFDSYLGATVQSQYRCDKCGKLTEKYIHCNRNTTLISGIKWIDNDLVNLFSICFSAVFAAIFVYFI